VPFAGKSPFPVEPINVPADGDGAVFDAAMALLHRLRCFQAGGVVLEQGLGLRAETGLVALERE